MKKMIAAALMLLFVSLSAFSSQGKYADVKKIMTAYSETVESLLASLDTANENEDAEAVGEALKSFIDRAKALNLEMAKLEKKYPELSDQDNVPEDLMPYFNTFMEKMTVFGQTVSEFEWSLYMANPEVAKALQELDEL